MTETKTSRWLVAGSGGMLGQDLVAAAQAAGHDVTGHADKDSLDVTDAAAVLEALQGFDVVVNCTAWTAVDEAETREPAAFAVNAVGAANLARGARAAGARMVHVSTDYVFDGVATTPYPEDGVVAPRSAYGRTKAAGEWAVRATSPDFLVVRTAWLYGALGSPFPKTIARVAAEREIITVVDDQVGQPTWTVDLADLILRLVAAEVPGGTYHGTSSGQTSWHGFATEVVASAGLTTKVEPISSDQAARAAVRPAYSVLGHDALVAAGIEPIGDWSDRWQVAAPTVLGLG